MTNSNAPNNGGKLSYSILVSSIFSHTAYSLIDSLISNKHYINKVFFYKEAVRLLVQNNMKQLYESWQEMAIQNNIELTICASSASDLGIDQVNKPFIKGGLGCLIESINSSDRFLKL